jgi:membrane protein
VIGVRRLAIEIPVRSLADARDLAVSTYQAWRDTRTIRLGAGLAYYGLFSLSSVVAVAVGMFRIISRSDAVATALEERLAELRGTEVGASIAEIGSQLEGGGGTQVGLIGLGTLLISGSLFFVALEDALNQIWRVPVMSGLRSSVRRRLISLVALLGAAATLVLSMGVQAATTVLEAVVPGSDTTGLNAIASLLTGALSWTVLAGALVLLFRFLPRADVAWSTAIIASIVTSLFVVVGTGLIGWYLRTVGAGSIGGVVSSPIVILVWIYYEAQILLAGAQLCRALELRRTTAVA